jgi:pteridine reductase
MQLDGAVAIVTGGARRLGAAIALELAGAGCHLAINYRASAADAEATANAARQQGVRALTVQGDMRCAADVGALVETTVGEFQRLDILVANAGVFRRTPIDTLTEADWDDLLDGNLRSAFLAAHHVGLHLRAHTGGAMVLLADIAGEHPWAGYLPYCVAKAGVIALTKGLAKELAPTVRVNAIAPGPVLFPEGYDDAARQREIGRTLLQRQGHPQDIADAALALLRNDYLTGVILPVDGGRGLT